MFHTAVDPVMKAQHRLRLRELSKYYCVTTPATRNRFQEPHDTSDQGYFGAVAKFCPRPPTLARDGILTALAQLAAQKLRCRRCLISIVDDQYQHVIAEATPSISFYDKDVHAAEEGLLLGVQPLPLSYGICPIGLTAFLGLNQLTLDNPQDTASIDHLAISDLLSESKTKDVPLVRQYPSQLRYFIEVPLRSESGYVLGSICVIDPVPRSIGADDIKALQDIAKLILQHLDWARMKEDHGRAERLIEGLSHFIQGKDSISDWSKATSGQANIPNVYEESAFSSLPRHPSSKFNTFTNDANTLMHMPPTPATSMSPRDVKDSSQSVSAASSDNNTSPESVPADSALHPLSSTDAEMCTSFDDPAEPLSEAGFRQSISASVKIRHAFSRASNLIRESMDLDATCILEIPHNERFKNAGRRKPTTSADGNVTDTVAQSVESGTSSDSSNELPLHQKHNPTTEDARVDDVMCHRLGFSTRTKSSLAGSNATAMYLTLPAKLVAKLTTKYPEGHVFRFDALGNLSSDDAYDATSPSVQRLKRESASHQLSRLFPDARSLVFLPLYDNDKQQVYAAFLGWTDDVARALQSAELTYVSGFTNSVMCEVMRLEATALDKAKSNFISSISHELRSPLHGILAANQLLSESKMYPQQAEFTHMIDTCARTLLDIMDHLLDHAKINHFVDRKPHGKRPKAVPKTREPLRTFSLVTSVDLLSVIEETAASMAASSNQLHSEGRKPKTGIQHASDSMAATDTSDKLSPPVIMNFKQHKKWIFKTEAGSWRRIIMNLLGNSIKYTQSGHISIDLNYEDPPDSSSSTTCIVELKVVDTGQGISEEYLKHRLYTPFAQENNLSVGTGLGLSLVHQIVSSLNGNVQVLSEVGTGTEVLVRVPLEICDHAIQSAGSDDSVDGGTLSITTGASFRMYGFERQPPISEHPTGVLHPHTKALMMMSESVTSMLTDWFGMKQTDNNADIFIIEETFLAENLDAYDSSSNSLFIIGMQGRGRVRKKLRHANCIYVLPPIGPKRLANGLTRLLQVHRERLHARIPTSPQTGLEIADPFKMLDTKTPLSRSSSDISADTNTMGSAESGSPQATVLHSPPTSPKDNSTTETTTEEALSSPGPRKDAILLVDDNDINLRILVATVTRIKGKTVDYITASNGQEALDRYIETVNAGTRISVIFMDISMPIMDGFKSTREIRAYERSKGMKKKSRATIVALTGLGSLEAQYEIDDCGFDVYLRKPASLEKIRETLPDQTTKSKEDN